MYTIKTPIEKGNILLSVPANVDGAAKLIIPAGLTAGDNPSITISLAEGASFTGSLTVENAEYEGTITLQAPNNEKIAIGTATVSTENILVVNLPKGSFTVAAGKINGSIKATTRPGTFTLTGMTLGNILIEGGSCRIAITGTVSGTIRLTTGAPLTVDGTVMSMITGSDVTINSTGSTKDIVIIQGGKIRVSEGAKIDGSVDASKATEVVIPNGTVTGDVILPEEPTKPIPVSGVSLNKTTVSLSVGAAEELVATVNPANATNQAVTWSSSNTGIATVSSTGVVTAKAVGTATITVTTQEGQKTATCVVTVSLASLNGDDWKPADWEPGKGTPIDNLPK